MLRNSLFPLPATNEIHVKYAQFRKFDEIKLKANNKTGEISKKEKLKLFTNY